MKKILLTTTILTIFLFSGCAGVNPLEGTGESYGFFAGFWDGFTVLFAFIGKMFGAGAWGIFAWFR